MEKQTQGLQTNFKMSESEGLFTWSKTPSKFYDETTEGEVKKVLKSKIGSQDIIWHWLNNIL